jgi:hypothetical protein
MKIYRSNGIPMPLQAGGIPMPLQAGGIPMLLYGEVKLFSKEAWLWPKPKTFGF